MVLAKGPLTCGDQVICYMDQVGGHPVLAGQSIYFGHRDQSGQAKRYFLRPYLSQLI